MNFYYIRMAILLFACAYACNGFSDNQTATVSPILSSSNLPFEIVIKEADFMLPNGIHSGAFATHRQYWLFITGRTNGMHSFNNNDNNFPPQKQNKIVYVVDSETHTVYTRSLDDPTSGLSQHQVDLLSVTAPQYYQTEDTLYISGGYGVNSATGDFSTKDALSVIDIPGLIKWVINPDSHKTAADSIRQVHHPILKVTGGYMDQANDHSYTLLIFGQDFLGFYLDSSNGAYTQQVRRFRIVDDGKELFILPKESEEPNPNYRRRDLNVVPVMKKKHNRYEEAYVALSGVFTLTTGAWTVPVTITAEGEASMADPSLPSTFKQGMNNYASARLGLFSKKTNDMYVVLFGGISFGFFRNGVFKTSSNLPFINQVTTIKIDEDDNFTQYLMKNKFPVILSTKSNPGRRLRFGAGAYFVPNNDVPMYPNGVFRLDKLEDSPILLGHIVGGIQSSVANTKKKTDSAASPYIFQVFLEPQ